MDSIVSWIEKITGYAETIGWALGILSVIVLGIVFVTGGRNGLEKGKGMVASILVGICVLSFGVAIVSSLRG